LYNLQTNTNKTSIRSKEDMVISIHMIFSFIKSHTLCMLCSNVVNTFEKSEIPDDMKSNINY